MRCDRTVRRDREVRRGGGVRRRRKGVMRLRARIVRVVRMR